MSVSRPWNPTTFRRFVKAVETSTGPAEIVTDAGPGFIKALGNEEGPHALACEWIGTKLAAWFGLLTFELALMDVEPIDEIPLGHGRRAEAGPAIVSRRERGHPWGGSADELNLIDNTQDVARLVVFDTWILNADRHPPDAASRRPNYDNVFLSEEDAGPERFLLKAIDHTHCLTGGRSIGADANRIDRVKDGRAYGLFPPFRPLITRKRVRSAAKRLCHLDVERVEAIIDSVPRSWEVSPPARRALLQLVCRRAAFVADNIERTLASECYPQGEFGFDSDEDGAT